MTVVEESTDEVAKAVAGLRELADFVEANPQFAEALGDRRFLQFVSAEEDFATLVHELGGRREKDVADDNYFGVSRWFGGIELYLYTLRNAVCEQVQTGTRAVEVRKDVCPKCQGLVELTPSGALVCREFGSLHFRADPPAQVTETVDEPVYEWRCKSVLRDAS